jgi:branched-chain amino acid transport system substrate-binding protein
VLERSKLTRRQLVGRGVGVSLAAGAVPVLAACGSSSSKSSGGASSSSGGGGASKSSGETTPTAKAGGVPAAVVTQLRDLLQIPTGKPAGEGLTVKLGASMAYSGAYAVYGAIMTPGVQLALKHIDALGGPKMPLTALDGGSGDGQKGAALARQLGTDGTPAMMVSIGADSGSELPFYKNYKMTAFEAGGATPVFQGLPYYYQTRAQIPTAMFPALVKYMQMKHPELKKWAIIANTSTPALQKSIVDEMQKPITEGGFQHVGTNFVEVAASDFSSNIGKLQSFNPDVVATSLYGSQMGLFLKQYATSGLKAKLLGMEYLNLVQQIAGDTSKGFIFGFDYFPVASPQNEWAKLFLSEYQRVFGKDPEYYGANYYESTFLVYQVIRQIIADGGDPTKQGDFYVNAIAKNPKFPSVYGGNGGKTGEMAISPTNHALTERSIGIFEANGNAGPPTVLATCGIGAVDFKLASA